MRTTLSLDPDVAAQLEAWQKTENLTFKQAVNTALRRGLADISRPHKHRKRSYTTPVDLGACLLPNLDNISEVLDFIEDDSR